MEAGRRARWVAVAGLGVVLLLGAGLRLAPHAQVFARDGVRFLGDSDPYYHALRAERIVRGWPSVPWSDPGMNFPAGATIPWPPLFDVLLALPTVARGATVSSDQVAAGAAWVPWVLGLVALVVLAALGGALLGRGPWIGPAFLLALAPGDLEVSGIGRPDQHVAEGLLTSCVVLAFVTAMRNPAARSRRAGVAALAVALTLSFWTWQGSALTVLLILAFAALWYVVAPAGDADAQRMLAAVALGSGGAAALLGLSLAALGPPGQWSRMSLNGLSGFQVLLTAAAALGAGALFAFASRRVAGRWGRVLAVCASAAGAAAVLALVPGARSEVVRGWHALARGNPWYAMIVEFEPWAFSGLAPAAMEVKGILARWGLMPLAVLAAALPLWRRGRADPEWRSRIAFLAFWGGVFLVLTLFRRRFVTYLAPPMAILAWLSVREAAAWAGGKLPGARGPWGRRLLLASGALVLLAPAIPRIAALARPGVDPVREDLVPVLTWLRSQVAPEGRPAVMAEWNYGHLVAWFARKPVVGTPFGTEGGEGALADEGRFFQARDAEVAETVLSERKVGFVLLGYPLGEIASSIAFGPVPAEPTVDVIRDVWKGAALRHRPSMWRLVVSRLYFFDGSSMDASAGLGGFRLVHESAQATATDGVVAAMFKTYEVVPGARVEVAGAAPGSTLEASLLVRSSQGRTFAWRTAARADASGRATLRVPYASGANRGSEAGPCLVTDGVRWVRLEVPAAAVEAGAVLSVDLSLAGG